jgi:osmoprotectant transport system permease protein
MKNKYRGFKTMKFVLSVLMITFFVWIYQEGYMSRILNSPGEFIVLLKQHITIVAASSLLAVLTAIPLGIFVTRPKFRKLEWLVLSVANLGQTIPSLAVLALAMGFLGLGFKPAVFALFIYSVLPILRNTVAGIDSIDKNLIDAAKGMGFKPHQILFQIELPNAAYSIMAGIRTSIVINIGTAALAFLIGGGGLGVWIFTGIQLFDNSYLLSGAVPVTVLAIVTDRLLRLLETFVVPSPLRRSIIEEN